MYHVCSECGALDALLKCDCIFITYYCNEVCQKAHASQHHASCSQRLLASIGYQQAELDDIPTADNNSTNTLRVELEQKLALLHCTMGRIMSVSQVPAIYAQAAKHCNMALVLHRKVRTFQTTATGLMRIFADEVVVDKISTNGLYDTLHNIGDICCLDQNYPGAIEAFSTLVDGLRHDVSVHNTKKQQTMLAVILGSLANVHVNQHHQESDHDNLNHNYTHCYIAIDFLQEAICLWDKLSREDLRKTALLQIATVYNDLGKFEKAQTMLHDAMAPSTMTPNKYTNAFQSTMHMASCHQQLGFNCLGQAMLLRKQLYAHQMFLISNSMEYYHSRLNMIRVEGLVNAPQYNGLEAVVLRVGAERIEVFLLEGYTDKVIKIKPANALPLIRDASELLPKFQKIQELTAKQIESSIISYELQLQKSGDRHINTAVTCYTLGTAYMKTLRKEDTEKALQLLIKADKIRMRIGDNHVERAIYFPQLITEAREALHEFETDGVLSPVTCCWAPSSRNQDAETLGELFDSLQQRIGSSTVSSDAMLDCLRLYGIFNVTAPAADSVDKAHFIAIACDELHRMKLASAMTQVIP